MDTQDIELVTVNGEEFALTPDEAFALAYFRRIGDNLTTAAGDNERRALEGAWSAIAAAGRYRKARLANLAPDAVPADLGAVRDTLRELIRHRTADVATGDELGDRPVRELRDLVGTYRDLGGDLELDPAGPKGPSAVELAAAAVVRAAAGLPSEFFAGRLEGLVAPLNELGEAVGRTDLTKAPEVVR